MDLSLTPQNVDRLALMSLKSPVFVSSDELKTEDDEDLGALEYTLPKQLKQHYVVVEDKRKLVTLMAFLRQKAVKECVNEPCIVLTN